jgi:hypothetical protein
MRASIRSVGDTHVSIMGHTFDPTSKGKARKRLTVTAGEAEANSMDCFERDIVDENYGEGSIDLQSIFHSEIVVKKRTDRRRIGTYGTDLIGFFRPSVVKQRAP